MLTTVLHIYLHVVVDIMYMMCLYAVRGDRTGSIWRRRGDAPGRTDGAPPSPESSLETNPLPNVDGPGREDGK